MINRVLHEELDEQVYDEEDSKLWSLHISNKVREGVQGRHHPNRRSLNRQYLTIPNMPSELLQNTRFKIIVQTTIGQLRDQGVKVASRCLWDPNTDNYASAYYTNVSLNRRPLPRTHLYHCS